MKIERFAGFGASTYDLRNARVPLALVDGLALREIDHGLGLATTDLRVADGRIARPAGAALAHSIDLRGRLVLPGFVDMHVHLDKAHTVRRTGLPAGGLTEAAALSMADMPNRTAEEIAARMEFSLQCAFQHGTVAMRTHLDSPDLPDDSIAWRVFAEMAAKWQGRIELQASALMSIQRVDETVFPERCAQLAARGGILGAFIAPGAATRARLDRLFELAGKHDLEVDFHVDETLNPAARGLEAVADAVMRTGYSGNVIAGHCCSLAAMPSDAALGIIDKVAEAGIHVVSLPLTNLFLQDRREGSTPARRGITLVSELRARGVPVSFASDNVCDPFFPYGDFDMLEVMGNAVRLAHLEGSVGEWIAAASLTPARSCGFGEHGLIRPGHPANLVHFPARDWIELFSRPQAQRLVIRDGKPIDSELPDYPELTPEMREMS
jgi:cytosine/creatinine deaminase